MESSSILSLLEQLDEEVDDLEDALAPLLKTVLSDTASKLPLLDKAKLYVLATYAIESILFSYLRLNGIKAREHPVFTELTRVKQYFDKINAIENPPERTLMVDKSAAARFIRAGLAGNDKYDLERAEREAKERVKMLMKSETRDRPIKKRKIDVATQVAGSASEFRNTGSDSDAGTGSSSSSSSSARSDSDHQAVAHLSPDSDHKKKQKTAAKPSSDSLETSSPTSFSMDQAGTASTKPERGSEGMESPSTHELSKKQRKAAKRVAKADMARQKSKG